MQTSNSYIGYLLVTIWNLSSVILSETLQICNKYSKYTLITRYINTSMTILLFWLPFITQRCVYKAYRTSQNAANDISFYKRDHSVASVIVHNQYTRKLNKTSQSPETQIESSLLASNQLQENYNTCHTHVDDNNVESQLSNCIKMNYTLNNFSFVRHLFWCFWGTIFQIGAGMLYYVSLQDTSVSTNTAILRTRVLWCYIFSIILGKEKFALWKVFGIFVMFVGVAFFVINLHDVGSDTESGSDKTPTDTLQGICMIFLASAMLPGCDLIFSYLSENCYYVQRHKQIQTTSWMKIVSASYFEAMQGIISIVIFCWVLFVPYDSETNKFVTTLSLDRILHEILLNQVLLNKKALFWILLNGFLLLFNDLTCYITNAFTTPVFVNVGSLMAVFFGYISDVVLHNYRIEIYSILGSISIILGFLIVNNVIQSPFNTKITR